MHGTTRSTASRRAAIGVAMLAFSTSALAQQGPLTPYQSLGRDLLKEMVETNTEYSIGSTTKLAESLAARFRAAGFPAADVQVVGPDSGRDAKDKNLIVRYRGRGKRAPILLIGHMDVVEAKPTDWVLDPFQLIEKDGHFYGRGTLDMKDGDASWVAAFLRLKQEGYVPSGDLILALTAGEEGGGGYNGMSWLIAHDREAINAQYVLNADGFGGELRDGKPVAMNVQAAEKVFHSVLFTTHNPGGHSSVPRKDNAIYELAAALTRWSAYGFPFETNAVTRDYFAKTAALMPPDLGAEMRAVIASTPPDSAAAAKLAARSSFYNAQLRTTCIATMIQGGHAPNAQPQSATATVNCRMMPGTDPAQVERTMRQVIADSGVQVTPADTPTPSPPSQLTPAVESAISKVTASMWGKLPLIPNMLTGATDGLFLRNAGYQVYGVTGMFVDPNNPDDTRAHGLNERISVKAYYDQLEFTYRLLKEL